MAGWSLVARFGLGMLNLSLLFFVRSETDSYSVAGALSAASLVGSAAGTVVQGRLIDRFGPARPLLAFVAPHALLGVAVVAGVRAGLPAAVLATLVLVQSAALPSVAVASRAMWPRLVPGGSAREAAYSYEAVSFEVCRLLGPVAAGVLATALWPGTALIVSLTLATVGAIGFSLARVVRHAESAAGASAPAAVAAVQWRGTATLLVAASGFAVGTCSRSPPSWPHARGRCRGDHRRARTLPR